MIGGYTHINKGMTVFVASGIAAEGCPTAKIIVGNVRFKDDYYGCLKISKLLAKSIF